MRCLKCQHKYDIRVFLDYYRNGQLDVFLAHDGEEVITTAWFPSVLDPSGSPSVLFKSLRDLAPLVQADDVFDQPVTRDHPCIQVVKQSMKGRIWRTGPISDAIQLSHARWMRYNQNHTPPDCDPFVVTDVFLLDTLSTENLCPVRKV